MGDPSSISVVDLANIGLVLATIALCIVTGRSVKVTERTLVSVQRAFVSPAVELIPLRDQQNKIVLCRVFISLENNGNTQTRNLRWTWTGGVDLTPDPEQVELAVNYGAASDRDGHGFLAPKSKITIVDAPLPRAKIAEITKGRGAYFYGRADYNDVFGNPHVTKFCVHIYGGPWHSGMSAPLLDMLIDNFPLHYNMCRCNNCIDDDCGEVT
jgi:hypothetical protein